MIINQHLNGGAPPLLSNRYWRVQNFTGGMSNGNLQLSEIALVEAGVVRSGGISPSYNIADFTGWPSSSLTDGALSGFSQEQAWVAADANNLVITFDLGVSRAIDVVRLGRTFDANAFPTACLLYTSPNGTTWSYVGAGTVVEPGVPNTMSADITFS